MPIKAWGKWLRALLGSKEPAMLLGAPLGELGWLAVAIVIGGIATGILVRHRRWVCDRACPLRGVRHARPETRHADGKPRHCGCGRHRSQKSGASSQRSELCRNQRRPAYRRLVDTLLKVEFKLVATP
jgi:hypothetical protein